MTKECCCCHADDTLGEAARQLWEHDCGSLPVVDADGVVQGMLTDRDICMAAYTTGKSLSNLRVASAMATAVATTHAAQSLREAELVMRSHSVRRLPVVDEGGRLVGMLSLNDLFRWTDDATAGATSSDAIHLVRTVATLGSSRHPRTVAAKPATVAAPGRGITQRSPGAASATVPHAAAQTTAV